MPGMQLDCANVAAAMGTQHYDAGDLSEVDTSHIGAGSRRRLAEGSQHRRLAGMTVCGGTSTGGHKVKASEMGGNLYKAGQEYIGYSITLADRYGRTRAAVRVYTAVNNSSGASSNDPRGRKLVSENIDDILEAAASNGRNAMSIDGVCVDCSAGDNMCIIGSC